MYARGIVTVLWSHAETDASARSSGTASASVVARMRLAGSLRDPSVRSQAAAASTELAAIKPTTTRGFEVSERGESRKSLAKEMQLATKVAKAQARETESPGSIRRSSRCSARSAANSTREETMKVAPAAASRCGREVTPPRIDRRASRHAIARPVVAATCRLSECCDME